MNVVLLSPHFPPLMRHFASRLRDVGATVLGVADAPYDQLHPELRGALTEYYRVDDLHDEDALTRALGWLTHRHGKIDRLDSLNEYWLETEARLRTDFNITGITTAEIDRIKRKSHMKRVFERAGIRVARGRVCRTPSQVRRFAAETGFPIIAKPDIGVGALQTYRIETGADLEAFIETRPPVDYILEEELLGQIVTYDGLTDRSGEVVFSSTLSYSISVLDAVRGGDIHYWISRDIPPDLDELGRRVARAFSVRERPFHFEFFRMPGGQLAALEVNLRQPGGLTTDMFNFANDIDFYRAWAEVVVTGRTDVRTARPYACLYAGRRATRHYRLSNHDVLHRYGDLIVHQECIDDVFATALGNHGYILRHPDERVLLEAAREIQAVAD